MKVAVIGRGYVGAVTPARLMAHGRDVWGTGIDAAQVDEIHQPGDVESVRGREGPGR